MDLSKYIDKTIRVKFQGGREGEPGAWLQHEALWPLGVFPQPMPVGSALLLALLSQQGKRRSSGCFYLLVVAVNGAKLLSFKCSIDLLGVLLWLICASLLLLVEQPYFGWGWVLVSFFLSFFLHCKDALKGTKKHLWM